MKKIRFAFGFGDLNPIRSAIYPTSFPHSQALNSDFTRKVFDTAEVFGSLFLYASGGIFILTTLLENICEDVRIEAANKKQSQQDDKSNSSMSAKQFFANAFYYPLKAINYVAFGLQLAFAIPLTIICLPFIGIAHGISQLLRAAKKHTGESLPVTVKEPFDLEEWCRKRTPIPPRQTTTLSLKELLEQRRGDSRFIEVTKVKKRPSTNDYKIRFEFYTRTSLRIKASAIVESNQDPRIRALAQISFNACQGLDENHFFDNENSGAKPARP